MNTTTFRQMFQQATGHAPFGYQERIAAAAALPSVVSVPTGMGKTAAAILGWLWRRRYAPECVRQATPRRLVYCLPMRVLVEQTRDCAVQWLGRLGVLSGRAGLASESVTAYDPWAHEGPSDGIRVHVLLGGDVDRDWDMFPERDAILVGTQDMLLSRGLNRGYAMSRYRWPLQFGLLANDCLWVMDEIQLMGDGLASTTQLQALRRKLGTILPTQSMWMSATLSPSWLKTVDFEPATDAPVELALDDADRQNPELQARFSALKALSRAPFRASRDCKVEAAFVLKEHLPGTRSLIIVNTVKRAQSVFRALKATLGRRAGPELVLLHSRFRPADRERSLDRLLQAPGERGTITVSTQVVEAGVDTSARLLVTDLAPWSSMVQRFGRCNRRGELNSAGTAKVVWIAPEDIDKGAVPYTATELRDAERILDHLDGVGPAQLPPVQKATQFEHVLRRKDLLDLFDTTPDLAGADVDVSRFIRDADDHDVRVFWREVSGTRPDANAPAPERAELCSVPIGELNGRHVWCWDHLDEEWVRPRALYPGLVAMLSASDGGYGELGWDGKEPRTPPVERPPVLPESDDSDPRVTTGSWQTIAEHTDRVVAETLRLLGALPGLAPFRDALALAARWHDVGKAHEIFQQALPPGPPDAKDLWAKSDGRMKRYLRPGFRHELASALAMLVHDAGDLPAYLAASHHGKVRGSIRSLPHERHPTNSPAQRFARGIWEGDKLAAVDLGGGVRVEETALPLSHMEMGDDPVNGRSWIARVLALRDSPDLGPFRLAMLEAILRVADWRASALDGGVR